MYVFQIHLHNPPPELMSVLYSRNHTVPPMTEGFVRLWQNVTFPIRKAGSGFLQRCGKDMTVAGPALGWRESLRHGVIPNQVLESMGGHLLGYKMLSWGGGY